MNLKNDKMILPKWIRFPFILLFFFLFSSAFAQDKQLLIFGGENQKVFLGCLNCDNYNPDSIWNGYGNFGSAYNADCIWNQYGEYGDAYSDLSPFNKYANHPPVIVDHDGNFYGYFTINPYHDKRADFKLVNTLYEYKDLIRRDLSGWYKKLFQ